MSVLGFWITDFAEITFIGGREIVKAWIIHAVHMNSSAENSNCFSF
jgi:hypothetical protein